MFFLSLLKFFQFISLSLASVRFFGQLELDFLSGCLFCGFFPKPFSSLLFSLLSTHSQHLETGKLSCSSGVSLKRYKNCSFPSVYLIALHSFLQFGVHLSLCVSIWLPLSLARSLVASLSHPAGRQPACLVCRRRRPASSLDAGADPATQTRHTRTQTRSLPAATALPPPRALRRASCATQAPAASGGRAPRRLAGSQFRILACSLACRPASQQILWRATAGAERPFVLPHCSPSSPARPPA